MLATIDQVSEKPFDYIVIGGGTTGLVVATRLSEDPSVSVLVLEAGAPNLNDPINLIPTSYYPNHLGNAQYDWGYETVPQLNANGRILYTARGKGLGGTSAINSCLFHLPSVTDIDAFEELGNKGWNWATLKKYYNKVEQFILPEVKDDTMRFDLREHGLEGPLEVGYPTLLSGFERPFVEAMQTLGINLASEPFSGDITGTWMSPVTVSPRTRTRCYSANMYYEPHASRNNLIVLTSAHVATISFSKVENGEATAESVSFLHDGNKHRACGNKEVIVSAGAIASPQVLELSGIGDPDVLQKAGIDVVVDLRGVGNNAQEHFYVSLTYQVKEELESNYVTFDCLNDPDELRRQTELYHAGEKVIFDMKHPLLAFVPLSATSPHARALQEKYLAPIQARIDSGDCPPGLRKQYKLQLEFEAQNPSHEILLYQSIGFSLPPDLKGKYVTFMSVHNRPLSRGSVHIKSSNPLEQPLIDPRHFEEEYDIQSFAESVKFTRRLVQQKPLKSIFIEEERFPGSSVQTDEEIIGFLRQHVASSLHTVGSCSMLPREDGGVVDNKLKVYGTKNIRVMDISVIPLHITVHPQATAYAIGELGADIIRGRIEF